MRSPFVITLLQLSRVAELARYVGLSRQACHVALRRLEDAHHVERLGSTHDLRAVEVVLTQEGQDQLDDACAFLECIEARLARAARLPETELLAHLSALRRAIPEPLRLPIWDG